MKKFKTIKCSNIITAIGIETNIKGYYEKIIEIVFPSDEEIDSMSKKENSKWIKTNNIRMEAICNFMNNFNVK